METRTYVDIHILQTVPPANLNRDDAGSPKQAIYGAVRRARVSSQAWKRAARVAFADLVPEESLATRTKKIAKILSDRLAARTGIDPDAATRIATTLLAPLEIKPGKKAEETAYLLFFGRAQIEELVGQVAERASDLAGLEGKALADALSDVSAKAVLGAGHPIDVALFGRMVANLPELNVDAATQVAHALSTHQAELQFDYYTAVDDENLDEETGAGMIGTIEFNSATLYRFATVELSQLLRNLGGDIEAATTALEVFLNAFTKSIPSGHTNSFAHRTLPGLVSVAVRDDQPINLVSAFESPIRTTAGTFDASVARLADEARKVGQLWGVPPLHLASTYSAPDADVARFREVFGQPQPFKELVTMIAGVARERMTGVAAG